MAALTPLTPSLSGPLLGAVAAAGGGDTFQNTGRELFYIKNGGGGGINVTFDSPGTCSFNVAANAAHDDVVAVGAGEERLIGPFPVTRFNDGAGNVAVSYSGVVTVTVAVIRP
jgi:hypothetical protein